MSQLLVCEYLVCEYLFCEVSVQNKRGLFVTKGVTIIAGDFNARSTTWLSRGTAATDATNIEALTSYHGFE